MPLYELIQLSGRFIVLFYSGFKTYDDDWWSGCKKALKGSRAIPSICEDLDFRF